MNITDIAAVAAIAKGKNILVTVDNTFASPYLQNPLELGADIVMHSATKYLSGHSDVIQGALMMNDKELRDQLYFIQKSCGAVPGPMDCFLVLRGIKTLHVACKGIVRMGAKLHITYASIRKWKKYIGPDLKIMLPIAKKQMRDFGGMISFTLKDDSKETVNRVLSSTHLFPLPKAWAVWNH